MPAKLSPAQIAVYQKLKDDFTHYARVALRIRTKSGAIEPLLLNKAQAHIHNQLEAQRGQTGKVRALILKGRQQGCSTLIGARFFHKVCYSKGAQAFILAHSLDATNNLFKMAQRFYEHVPKEIQPSISKSNAKELIFGRLDSGYKLGTAENKQVGRSATIQLLHGSEVGFWNNAAELSTGILQAVPNAPNTEIILESTANGVGNFFHQQWQAAESGQSEYIPVFVPWYWQEEYHIEDVRDMVPTAQEEELMRAYHLTLNQVAWRRKKVQELSVNGIDGEKAFQQEYPCIVASQRVGSSWGIIPIENIILNDITVHGVVTNKWNKGYKETIQLETELGYTLQCTPEHKIAVDRDFLEAQNSLGKSVILSPPKFSDQHHTVAWLHLPSVEARISIDERVGLFLGFFMGDGSYSDDVLSFAFNAADQDCINIIRNLVFELFGINLAYRNTSVNGAELRASCKKLRELFLCLGIAEQRTYGTKRKVCVPNCIWRSPKEIVAKFLMGLFEADGFAGKRDAVIKFFTKHEQFGKDIQLLLLGFGITSRRIHCERQNGAGFIYMGTELSLRASEAREFVRQIGFMSERKTTRQECWRKPFEKGRDAHSISLLDKVKSITNNGVKEVYDLEIESNHVFDANGFLVHNCTAAEAFVLTGEDNYIPGSVVLTARKTTEVEAIGPLILGVDPARFGDDRTALIRRRGRVAYKLETFIKKDTMEVAGLVHQAILAEKPDKVVVDVGAMGGGVVDRLKELGHADLVVGINFGGKPLDAIKYRNKKAEMWGEMLAWFNDEPCQVPDSDELQSDLCNTKYRVDSNSRLEMESKEHMKHRGIRSSDCADALALTFALPNSALSASIQKSQDEFLAGLANDYSQRAKSIEKSWGR